MKRRKGRKRNKGPHALTVKRRSGVENAEEGRAKNTTKTSARGENTLKAADVGSQRASSLSLSHWAGAALRSACRKLRKKKGQKKWKGATQPVGAPHQRQRHTRTA